MDMLLCRSCSKRLQSKGEGKMKKIKFMIGLICIVWLAVFVAPTIYRADEDTRTHIDRVDISTNIDEVFGYGMENTTLQPTLQMSQTTSEPVSLKPYYGFWQRYIDDDGRWEFSGYDYFISGQWSMTIQIRVTDAAYLIDNETAVYVDGELWEVWDKEDGSYPFIVVIPSRNSSRFFIEEPEELTFHKLGKYDISGQRVNTRIEPFSVVSSVEGGTAPYSYRKVSGPDWLEVSVEGTVSGKPTEIGANEPLVVEVLDSKGGTAQITIPVDDTLEEYVIAVSTWDELEDAFSEARGSSLSSKKEYLTIRLTKDLYSSAYNTERDAEWIHQYEIYRASVIFDFNGHTLSCTDDVSDTDIEYTLKDFINIKLSSGSYDFGSSIRFIDSVGGGGIEMYSKRAWETCDLAALHIEAGESSLYGVHQVYFDGGKYELNAESSKVGVGTLSPLVDYRGCVITEEVSVEINDGHFIAKGEGAKFSVGDTCARELAAFGTFEHARFNVTSVEEIEKMFGWDEIVINGGIFESNGYAVHHFDISENGLDSTRGMLFPTINGGYFIGQMGYTGLTFTYSDGNELFNDQPATSIISENSYVMGIDEDGDKFYTLEDMTLKDLHDLQSCIVLGKETVQMKTSPVAGSYPAALIRESTETETYTIEYKEPSWFATGGIQCVPYYKIQGWQSATTTSKTGKTEVTVDYSKYKHNGGVDVKLGVMYITPWNTTDYSFENEYNVELQVFYDITDACKNCYIEPVNGEFRVLKGEDFSFYLNPNEGYWLSIGPLNVVTEPNYVLYYQGALGGNPPIYTIKDVQDDVTIEVIDGEAGPVAYFNLKLDLGADKETASRYVDLRKTHEQEENTLLEPAEYAQYGFTVPAGYTFEKWVVTTPSYSFSIAPGESFKITGDAGDVIISPKYKSLYNIQVVNGTAYADPEHTQPIDQAVEGQTVYFVADAPDTDKVFWKWNVIAGSSIHYTDVKESEFIKTIYYDTVYEACYATQIDEMTLTIVSDAVPEAGMQVPSIEEVDREAYTFYPPSFYDVTDGSTVFPDIENFEVGHIYQIETTVMVTEGYLLDDISNMTLNIEGLTGYESVEMQTVYGYDNERYKIIIRFPAIEGPEGVTVSGAVTSYGSESAIIEVTLTNVENEKISFVRLLVGNSTTYSIDGVAAGTYTLRATKAYHEAYETTIVVSEDALVKDVALELDENVETVKNATIKHNCSFGNDFTLLYAIPKSELAGFENIRLSVEKDVYSGDTLTGTEVVVLSWTDYMIGAVEYYRFDYSGVSATEVGDELRATLIAECDGVTYYGTVDVYNLKDYAYNRLTKSSDEEFKRMLVDMLDYCSAAQTFFEYRASELVNNDLTDEQRALSTDTYGTLLNNDATITVRPDKTVSTIRKNVRFGNRTELLFAIDLSAYPDRSGITMHVEYTDNYGQNQELDIPGSSFEYNESLGMYCGVVNTLSAAELRKVLYVTVLYDGEPVSDTISYSIETYICKKVVSSDDELFKELLKELMVYGDSCEASFN